MINNAFILEGEISHYGSPGDDEDFVDGETYEGYLCKNFPVDENLAVFSRVKFWNYSSETWEDRIEKPTHYYEWQTTSWVLNTTRLHTDIRSIRNSLLLNTDFTQLSDSPAGNTAAWATYRQELRDFMQNVPADLDDIVDIPWPTHPS